MSKEQAIQNVMALFSGFGIDCDRQSAEQLVDAGMNGKLHQLIEKAKAA